MSIKKDIAEERIRIGRAVQKSKLGRAIVDRILDPILKEIDLEMDNALTAMGRFVVLKIQENILKHGRPPSGITYTLIEVDSSDPDPETAYKEIGTYTASAPGDPPANLSGSLFESISFEIDNLGRIRVGIFDSFNDGEGKYSGLHPIFYRPGKLFVSENPTGKVKPVQEYANILDLGWSNAFTSVSARPWFRTVMEEIRPQIRTMIRERLKKALRKATRSRGVKTAIYFRVYFDNQKALESAEGYTSGVDRILDDVD